MHILAVGLNFRTAPVEVRERFAIEAAKLPLALNKLKSTKSILECVIVATCNRTEIYAVVDRMHVCGYHIRNFMADWFQIPMERFINNLYIHENERAIEHLFRVTCGLDSMVVGETQILGQIRDAFLLAQKSKTTGTLFNMLFKQAVTLAKRAHSETGIGESAVSVSYAAVELGKRIFGNFQDKHVMIIGAGKMSELTAKHLHASGARDITVVNRTLARARSLADKFAGVACTTEAMDERLPDVDIIISSTGSSGYVLTQEQVKQFMPKRMSRPLFLIDIAVPRDLDPGISDIPNVFLYDIDDLEGMVESNKAARLAEARKIEAMIEREMHNFAQWYKTLDVVPIIRALQKKSASIHEETMESLWNKLPDLDERERKVIRKLTKSIVNQMMQEPILRIKDAAAGRHGAEAMEWFVKFFALEEALEHERSLNKAAAVAERKEASAGYTPVLERARELLVRS